MNTNAEWLGLGLKNPIVLASLTPISHSTQEKQVDFYLRAEHAGFGAIVLESFVPIPSNSRVRGTRRVQNDLLAFSAGITTAQEGRKHSYMGVALLGPPHPNISAREDGLALAGLVSQHLTIPVFGSIANYGQEAEFLSAVEELSDSGVQGLELNFSCPNLGDFGEGPQVGRYCSIPLSLEIMHKARCRSRLPCSIKMAPGTLGEDLTRAIVSEGFGITYSNAYSGLVPAAGPSASPFGRPGKWSISGVYGPFQRMLNYRDLWVLRQRLGKSANIAFSGGAVSSIHVVEALQLGATVVQLGVGVLWNGLKLATKANAYLQSFGKSHGVQNLQELGRLLDDRIVESAALLDEYSADHGKSRPPVKITETCTNCMECVDVGCLAIEAGSVAPVVNQDLCSGCGWCEVKCPVAGAIVRHPPIESGV